GRYWYLTRGYAVRQQKMDPTRLAAMAAQRAGKQAGLVAAPAPESPGMQRHRRDQVAVGEQLRTGLAHQSGQAWREIGAVAALEAQHQFAAAAVIDENRAGAGEARWPAHAGAADQTR